MNRLLRVSGIVQGVGFRPYVWHLARELGLAGWVRNDAAGVTVLVQGDAVRVESFTQRLPREIPPLARVDALHWDDAATEAAHSGFVIAESGGGAAATMIGHDTAVCPDCLAELFDPADRRHRYAFINCTHCGPRYTLTRRLPYDRAQTSMATFPLCPACDAEYRDPANRRFHAEPTACPVCGPRLWVEGLPPPSREGLGEGAADPIADTLRRLQAGEIVALKGLGGFHLACDARNPDAVARLRARKHRDEKPFAIMAANVASLTGLAQIDAAQQALLTSPERPIVLLPKQHGMEAAFPGIAPGLAWVGAMLPYTPLHWLLFHEAAGRPAGTGWCTQSQPLLLVMTSANPGGEPLVIGNDEAMTRLAGISDAVLMHDRDIVVRCDDSVVRAGEDAVPHFIRRARGYTPRAIRLPREGLPVLALGGYLKNTVCVTRGAEAFVSQHIGGLDNAATCAMLDEVSAHLLDILRVQPVALAHDLHPDFYSSRRAGELAARWGVPAIGVQHHHAHIAAVLAEHDASGPVLGLALDGIGLGEAGGVPGGAWGGELLRVQGGQFDRLGHLATLPLPGGDRAAQAPWRMAAAALYRLGRGDEIATRFASYPAAARLHELLTRGVQCPPTSSLGRWFDAAAGLLGVRDEMAYEGQAAMLLEGLAARYGPVLPLPDGYRLEADGTLDLLPLLAHLAQQHSPARDAAHGAALFHATLAQALADWVLAAAQRADIGTVACGGGCFLNHILTHSLGELLTPRGLRVLFARQVPPNDGGLSLGQAWVAMQQLQ